MIEQRLEDLQKQLDELKAQMKTPEDRFVPQINRRYWYVDSIGEKSTSIWTNSPGDLYRLATGNCHRTEADARRHKAGLFVKTPTGPCPMAGSRIYFWSLSMNGVGMADAGAPMTIGAHGVWMLGQACLEGFQKELKAKWRKYGWSVTGEPEPEGWES